MLPVIACKNSSSSELVCFLPAVQFFFPCVNPIHTELNSVTKQKSVGMMFLHSESLHSMERIKRRL